MVVFQRVAASSKRSSSMTDVSSNTNTSLFHLYHDDMHTYRVTLSIGISN